MRYQQALVAACVGRLAAAFPRMPIPAMEKRAMIEGRDDPPASGVPIPDPAQVAGIFNAELQYVSNAGAHAFVAPGEGDQRGPCPGLNAMANHNYIPHNGIATIEVC